MAVQLEFINNPHNTSVDSPYYVRWLGRVLRQMEPKQFADFVNLFGFHRLATKAVMAIQVKVSSAPQRPLFQASSNYNHLFIATIGKFRC